MFRQFTTAPAIRNTKGRPRTIRWRSLETLESRRLLTVLSQNVQASGFAQVGLGDPVQYDFKNTQNSETLSSVSTGSTQTVSYSYPNLPQLVDSAFYSVSLNATVMQQTSGDIQEGVVDFSGSSMKPSTFGGTANYSGLWQLGFIATKSGTLTLDFSMSSENLKAVANDLVLSVTRTSDGASLANQAGNGSGVFSIPIQRGASYFVNFKGSDLGEQPDPKNLSDSASAQIRWTLELDPGPTVTPSLEFDDATGGVKLGYTIGFADLPQPASIELYWASGTTADSEIGDPIVSESTETAVGSYEALEPSSLFTNPPQGATCLLAVADTNHIGFPNVPVSFVSIPLASDTTTTLETDSPLGSDYDQDVTFTATVNADNFTAGTPTGSVEFDDGGTVLGTVDLVDGVATLTTSDLLPGDHDIVAVYTSDNIRFSGSKSDALTQTINKIDTFIIGNFDISGVYGQTLSFAAVVDPFPRPSFLPTGTLNFLDDGIPLPDQQAFNGIGSVYKTSQLGAGRHEITVVYGGDDNFKPNYFKFDVDVSKAPLTVTADDQDMDQNDSVPPLSYHFDGFVNNETAGVLSGMPDVETSDGSKAGVYPITIAHGTLSSANYAFNFVPGSLTVHPYVTDVIAHYGSKSMSIMKLSRDLPFADLTSIEVLFSDNVSIPLNAVTLIGRGGQRYGFSESANPFSAGGISNPPFTDELLKLPAALGADQLTLSLTNKIGASSAQAATLKPFQLRFSVLPGDVNGDSTVDSLDLVAERNGILGILDKALDVWADIDGDGKIDLNDYTAVKKYVGKHL